MSDGAGVGPDEGEVAARTVVNDMELSDQRHVSLPLAEQVPQTMRGVTYKLHGSPWSSLLEVMPERPTPRLTKNNEVLVRVHAVGLNRLDVRTMRGDFAPLFLGKKHHALPFSPGIEMSGTVVQAGLDCRRIKKGDQVYGFADWKRAGCMNEYVLMLEKEVNHKPVNMTHAEAAALPGAGTAAYKALVTIGMVDKGHKILVLGGSGGVGTLAVQLGKALGAHVACTCRGANSELMQSLGADFIIDYQSAQWFELLRGENFDTIVDLVDSEESWKRCQDVLSPSGTYITLVAGDRGASEDDQRITFKRLVANGASTLNRKFWSVFGGVNYETVSASPNAEVLNAIRDIVEAQAVRPVIDRIYKLDDAVAALAHVASGRTRGKVVVSIVPDAHPPQQQGDPAADHSHPPEEGAAGAAAGAV